MGALDEGVPGRGSDLTGWILVSLNHFDDASRRSVSKAAFFAIHRCVEVLLYIFLEMKLDLFWGFCCLDNNSSHDIEAHVLLGNRESDKMGEALPFTVVGGGD